MYFVLGCLKMGGPYLVFQIVLTSIGAYDEKKEQSFWQHDVSPWITFLKVIMHQVSFIPDMKGNYGFSF